MAACVCVSVCMHAGQAPPCVWLSMPVYLHHHRHTHTPRAARLWLRSLAAATGTARAWCPMEASAGPRAGGVVQAYKMLDRSGVLAPHAGPPASRHYTLDELGFLYREVFEERTYLQHGVRHGSLWVCGEEWAVSGPQHPA